MSDGKPEAGGELGSCPFCGCEFVSIEKSASVFAGQDYGDRYPRNVATQRYGFRVRCEECGCQTCWWHYESEAVAAWNRRHSNKEITRKETP
jgi:hypothetical protein